MAKLFTKTEFVTVSTNTPLASEVSLDFKAAYGVICFLKYKVKAKNNKFNVPSKNAKVPFAKAINTIHIPISIIGKVSPNNKFKYILSTLVNILRTFPEILPDISSSKKPIECLCVITNKSLDSFALKNETKYASTMRLRASPALKSKTTTVK